MPRMRVSATVESKIAQEIEEYHKKQKTLTPFKKRTDGYNRPTNKKQRPYCFSDTMEKLLRAGLMANQKSRGISKKQ